MKVLASVPALTRHMLPAPVPARPHMPDDDPERPIRHGLAILAVFFGLLGTLLVVAPMNGAVVANGSVTIDGNRKSVQHLDGGIVKDLRVKDGQRVAAGETLIVLDDTQARAEHEVLRQLFTSLSMTEARLAAELTGANEPIFPQALAGERNDPAIAAQWRSQLEQFRRRGQAMSGRGGIIAEKIAQLEAQAAGSVAQRAAIAAQLASVRDEIATLAPLLDRGLVTKPRVTQLERNRSQLEGQLGEIEGTIAHQRQAIAEQREQSAQVGKERSSDVAQELNDVRSKLAETVPRLMNARAALSRTNVTSPYTGRVVALNVVSVGAVIGRGERILDVVPEDEALIVEAQVPVEEIAEVRGSMAASVRLTAYKQRSTPLVSGTVVQVSADRLNDSRTNAPYFLARVRVEPRELAALEHVQLYPGMPATVLIPTEHRTAFQYLVSPLTSAFTRAFRER